MLLIISVIIISKCFYLSAFNLQNIHKSVVVTNGRRGTEFGYSVALHENNEGKWLIVGAPKDYTGEENLDSRLPRDGALHSCHLTKEGGESSNVANESKCLRLDMEIPSSKTGVLLFNDFESNNFTQVKGSDFEWELHVGPSISQNTGPPYDHTLQKESEGRYMLLECSVPRTVGEAALLATPNLQPTNAACVRFWYHMYGGNMGSLHVYIFNNSTGSRMIWSKYQDQGEEWLEGRVTVISHEQYQIIFEGVVGQHYDSDIGLDDVTILDGVCHEDIKPVNQSLGMTLATNKETGQVLACAPTWSYTCRGQNHATGLCYLLNDQLQPSTMKMLAPCRSPSCTEGKMDLIFLIDGSDSIIISDFKKMIRWLNNVVSSLPLGRDLTRIGVAQYTSKPQTEFNLNQYFTLEDMRAALKTITHKRGTTATGRGINYVSEEMFSKEKGMRADAKHVAVVITDGKSQDDVIRPSKDAKDKGITIFAIGVGSVVEAELRNISSDPDDQFVYMVTSYEALDGIRDQLQKKLFSLESQGSAITTEQCQAGMSADFVDGMPVIGLPGLQDWSGGFALYSNSHSNMIRTSFKDLLSPDQDVSQIDDNNSNNSDAKSSNWKSLGSITSSSSSSSSIGSNVHISLKVGSKTSYSETRSSHPHQSSKLAAPGRFLSSQPRPQGLKASTAVNEGNKTLQRKLKAAGLKSKDDLISKMLVHSYLGYSISSGSYTQTSAVEIAISAPRMLSVGSVFIVQLNDNAGERGTINEPVIMEELSGSQMGSYFGYSLCMTDMNGDGLDELLIGAPMWMGKYQDMGQVVVYVSNLDDNGRLHPRQKIIFSGSSERGARFGFTVVSAGDLNQDGFMDVAIGAPGSADGDGSIFIYNGRRDLTQISFPSQIIRASQAREKLVYFGFSLHGGVDMDNNGYVDLAVGVPGNDKALVIFSRPVIHVTVELTPVPSLVNISSPVCRATEEWIGDNKPVQCSIVKICFTITGHKIPPIIYLNYELMTDVDRPSLSARAYFQRSNFEIQAVTDEITCLNKTLAFKEPIRDISTDLKIALKYSLSDQMLEIDKSPIIDIHDENPVGAEIAFARDCESARCKSDLISKCLVDGMEPYLGSKVIILEANHMINVLVNLSNSAEDAYDVHVEIVYDENLFFNKLTTMQNNPCVLIVYDGDDVSSEFEESNKNKTENNMGDESVKDSAKRIRLMYKDAVLGKRDLCSFKLQFGIHENLKVNSRNVSISIKSSSSNQEVDITNNLCDLEIPVYYSGKIYLTGFSDPAQVSYRDEDLVEHISKFSEIGPELSHTYFVTNLGHSTIPVTSVKLNWPSETISRHDILYLTAMDCEPSSKCNCKDLDLLVNPDQLNSTESMEVESNRGEAEVELVDMNNETSEDGSGGEYTETQLECGAGGSSCETMQCFIAQLNPSETVKIVLTYRLWQDTLVKAKILKSSVTTNAEISTEISPQIILKSSTVDSKITTSIYSTSGLRDDVSPVSPRIWVIVLSIFAGLFLLGLTTLALYRAGFFESKYKMKKDETLEWRDFDQFSSSHVDRIDYDADMPEESSQPRLTTFQRRNQP